MNINETIDLMVKNNEPDEVIQQVVDDYNGSLKTEPEQTGIEKTRNTEARSSHMIPPETDEEVWEQTKDLARGASPYVRAGLAGLGAVAGGAAGMASPMPGGTVIGGAGGMAIGETAADKYDEWVGLKETPGLADASLEAAGHFKTGLMWEMGVPSALKVAEAPAKVLGGMIKDTWRLVPFVKKANAVKQEVADITYLIATGNGELKDLPEETIKALKKEMPELNISWGQATNSQNIMSLESAGKMANKEGAIVLDKQIAEHNQGVMEAYLGRTVERSGAGQSEVVKAVESIHANNKAGIESAQKDLDAVSRVIEENKDNVVVAGEGKKYIQDSFDIAKAKRTAEWEGMKDTGPLVTESNGVLHDLTVLKDDYFSSVKDKRLFPATVNNTIEKLGQTPRTLKELHSMKSDISSAKRSYQNTPGADTKITKTYQNAEEIINSRIEAVMGKGYKEISRRYANYVNLYKKGVTGKILAGDTTESLIPGKYLAPKAPEKADELIEAIGYDQARDLAKSDALNRLYNKAGTKGLTAKIADDFHFQNRELLEKFGLADEFNDFATTAKNLDTMKATDARFQKTVASELVGENISSVLNRTFKNATPEAQKKITSDILGVLEKVKGHPEAYQGFKNALLDHAMYSGGGNLLDAKTMKAQYDLYEPSLRLLFKQEELEAMRTVRKAIEVTQRKATQQGFETEEDFINSLVNILTPMMVGKYSRIVAVKTAVKGLLGKNRKEIGENIYKMAYNPTLAKEFGREGQTKAFQLLFNKSRSLTSPGSRFGGVKFGPKPLAPYDIPFTQFDLRGTMKNELR